MNENTPNGGQASEPQPYTFNEDGTFNLPDGNTVSAEELGKGYLRQSDYTRKTQDLAIQRKDTERAQALMAQLEANPKGTLEALAKNLGVEIGQAPAPTVPAPRQNDDWGDSWDDNGGQVPQQEDPRIAAMAAQMEALMGQVQQLAGTQARGQVESEMDSVVNSFAEQGVNIEDRTALLRYAKEHGIGNLEQAATLMYQDDIVEARIAAATKSAGEEKIVEEKRGASQAVTPGTGSVGSDPSPAAAGDDGKLDIRAALEASLVEHNVTDIRDVSFDSQVRSHY